MVLGTCRIYYFWQWPICRVKIRRVDNPHFLGSNAMTIHGLLNPRCHTTPGSCGKCSHESWHRLLPLPCPWRPSLDAMAAYSVLCCSWHSIVSLALLQRNAIGFIFQATMTYHLRQHNPQIVGCNANPRYAQVVDGKSTSILGLKFRLPSCAQSVYFGLRCNDVIVRHKGASKL